jgi:hypothetical protein
MYPRTGARHPPGNAACHDSAGTFRFVQGDQRVGRCGAPSITR